MYSSLTKLKWLYGWLGAKDKCLIKEPNWISLIYFSQIVKVAKVTMKIYYLT